MIGIYKIVTKHNNKVYIGSSQDVEKRFYCHISRLKRNKHHSPYLQAVYNKYGILNLEFSIIEVLDNVNFKIEREQYWIDYYKSYDKKHGYNVSRVAICNTTGEKKIYQYDTEGNFIKEWNSIKSAKDFYSLKVIRYSENCTSGNFQWRLFKTEKLKSKLKIYCCYNLEGSFVNSFLSAKEIQMFFKVSVKSLANLSKRVKDKTTLLNHQWRIYNSYDFPKQIEGYTRKTVAKKVGQFDKSDNLINCFSSLTEAAASIHVSPENLHRVVDSNNPSYKTCRGFIWKYI